MWQQRLYKHIKQALARDSDVLEVVPLGSLVNHQSSDEWSDLDLGIVVIETSFERFYPSVRWIEPFGSIYAVSRSVGPRKGTSRVVFTDGTRVDFSITTDRAPLGEGRPAPSEKEQAHSLYELFNEFKFDAFLAISKVARNDKLIGLHLTLGLESKCLVLAMKLRDRELGVTHHRFGGAYNEVVAELGSLGATETELLDRIQGAARLFERLAAQLDESNSRDWRPLEEFIERARRRTSSSGAA